MQNFISALGGEGGNQIWMLVILGVFLVLMIVMSIVPQRKQKKKQEEMMNSIQVGSKIMTIGGIIGVIVEYDPATDYYTLNVGTKTNPSYIVIVKNAIRSKLDDAAVISYEPPKAEEKKNEAEAVQEEKKDEI